jgi:heat-inducible transcriptional repressor
VTLETQTELKQSKLDELRVLLNERLAGRSFREVKATVRERISDLSAHDQSILRLFIDSPEKLFDDTGSDRVKMSGARNIFAQPEFQGRDFTNDEEFQSIIELIDNEEVVIHVLERSGSGGLSGINDGIAIRIGAELEERNMTGYSLICTKYRIGGERGIIGLIGPKRMDYDRIAPLVEYVARAMSGVLAAK